MGFLFMQDSLILSPSVLTVDDIDRRIVKLILGLQPPTPFMVSADIIDGVLIIVAIPEADIKDAIEHEDVEMKTLMYMAPGAYWAFSPNIDMMGTRLEDISGLRMYISVSKP